MRRAALQFVQRRCEMSHKKVCLNLSWAEINIGGTPSAPCCIREAHGNGMSRGDFL